MQMKICNKCGRELPITNWVKSKQSNPSAWCKECKSLYNKQHYKDNTKKYKNHSKVYRIENRERCRENDRKYYQNNKEKWERLSKEKKVLYHTNEEYRQSEVKRKAKWRKDNPSYHTDYCNKRRDEDPIFRMTCSLRSRIKEAIKNQRSQKAYKSIELLGCTIEECRTHLESQFTDGMSWDNYGDWHVDHIRPCTSFDLADPKQQKECFNYKNLQPLWAYDNISKGDKWEGNKNG